MIALLDSPTSAGFDTADQARRLLAWVDTGAYTPHVDGRLDIGGATAAFARLRWGVPAEEAGADANSQGNGSLMRILPIALVDPPDDTAELIDRAHRSSAITHAAPECLTACAVCVLVARRLADGERDRPSALAAALADVEAEYRRRGDPALLAALELLRGHTERKGRSWVIDSSWSAWDALAEHAMYRFGSGSMAPPPRITSAGDLSAAAGWFSQARSYWIHIQDPDSTILTLDPP